MIAPLTFDNISQFLPLVRAYQEFYQVAKINDERNQLHFARFIDDTHRGIVFLATRENAAIGFCTIYFSFSSARAEEIAILNDLYVDPSWRQNGIGKSLILHALAETKTRGLTRLQWLTGKNNVTAKRLYDSLPVSKSDWTLYAMDAS